MSEPKSTDLPSVAEPPERQAAFWHARSALLSDLLVATEQFCREKHHFYFLPGFLIQALASNGIAIPRFTSIPMLSLPYAFQLPLPFAEDNDTHEDSWEKWLDLTSSSMVRESSFEEGEWCGYISADPYLLSFSTLLEDIRFQVVEELASISVKGDDREGGRSLTLEVEVDKEKTRILISQECPNVHSCRWNAFMTPFGIVGYLDNIPRHNLQPSRELNNIDQWEVHYGFNRINVNFKLRMIANNYFEPLLKTGLPSFCIRFYW